MIRFTPASVCILSGVIAAFHLGKVSPAIPILQSGLGLTLVQAGFLLSFMQIAGMVAGVLIGMYCDRLGARRSLLIGQGILCAASLAGALGQNPYHLLLLRAVESLGFLMVVLPTPGLLRRLVIHERLALHLGLWGCYVALGTSAAFFAGPLFLEHYSWRLWWCLPAAASVVIIYLLDARLPRDPASPRRPGCQGESSNRATWYQKVVSNLRGCNAWLVGIAFAMYAGQWLAVIGFLPSIYAAAGVGAGTSGPLTALAALANIVGNVSAAVLLHRSVQPKRILNVGYVGMALMALVAFLPYTASAPTIQYLAVLLFSAIGGVIPGSLYLLAIQATPNERNLSSTFGRVQQLTSTGMFLMPPLIARLAHVAGGWHWTWLATGCASVVGLLLVSRLTRKSSVSGHSR